MGPEADKILQHLDDQSSQIFLDFMTRTAKFEELVSLGQRFLVGFYKELEILRKPQLDKKSDLVDALIKSTHNDMMEAYTEAGCKPPHVAIQNISNLHSCKQGLLDHLKQVKVLLGELEGLKEDVIGVARQVNQSASDVLDISFRDGSRTQHPSEKELEPVQKDKSIFHASILAFVLGMLQLDFLMQEKIIKSIDLTTSLSQLESYCLIWNLRPYINDNILDQAWRFIPG